MKIITTTLLLFVFSFFVVKNSYSQHDICFAGGLNLGVNSNVGIDLGLFAQSGFKFSNSPNVIIGFIESEINLSSSFFSTKLFAVPYVKLGIGLMGKEKLNDVNFFFFWRLCLLIKRFRWFNFKTLYWSFGWYRYLCKAWNGFITKVFCLCFIFIWSCIKLWATLFWNYLGSVIFLRKLKRKANLLFFFL